MVYEGSTQIGCVNGYGNFTTDLIWCYPFRSFTSTGDYSTLDGYAPCSASTGTLVCYEVTAAADTQFYVSDGNLAIGDTGTTTSFSVNSIPATTDNVGVPLLVGSGGAIQVTLLVDSVQG